MERWRQYASELFNDSINQEHGIDEAATGPPISKNDVEKTLKMTKNGKAPGLDGLRSEIVKLLFDIEIATITKLFETIYNTGQH